MTDRIDRRLSRLNDFGRRDDLNPLLRIRIFLQLFLDDIHLADQLDFDAFICVYCLNGAFYRLHRRIIAAHRVHCNSD